MSNPFWRVSSKRLYVFASEPAHYSSADRSSTVCGPERMSWICSIVPCILSARTLTLRCMKWHGCWKCRMIQFIRRTYSRATPENNNSTPSLTHALMASFTLFPSATLWLFVAVLSLLLSARFAGGLLRVYLLRRYTTVDGLPRLGVKRGKKIRGTAVVCGGRCVQSLLLFSASSDGKLQYLRSFNCSSLLRPLHQCYSYRP